MHLKIAEVQSALGEHTAALDHAFYAYRLAMRYFKSTRDHELLLSSIYLALGQEYKSLDRKKEAAEFFKRGLTLAKNRLRKEPIT